MDIPESLINQGKVGILIVGVVWAARSILTGWHEYCTAKNEKKMVDNLVAQTEILRNMNTVLHLHSTKMDAQSNTLNSIGITLATADSKRHTALQATKEHHTEMEALGKVCKFTPPATA